MAPFDEQVAAGFPAPHRDEPRDLRRDIADELADHVACALAQEMKKTPDEAAARAAVLDRFGDPARLARRLWLDWMKEAIMKDRILMAGIVLVALATLAVAAFGWMLFKGSQEANRESRETNRAMLAAIEKMSAPKESPAEVHSDLALAKIRVASDSPGKEPVEGATVILLGDPFGDSPRGAKKLEAKTDRSGLTQFGPIRPGQYRVEAHLPNGLSGLGAGTLDLFGGKTAELTVSAPALPKVQVEAGSLELPEDLRNLAFGFSAELSSTVQASDGQTWAAKAVFSLNAASQPATSASATEPATPSGPSQTLPSGRYLLNSLTVDMPPDLSKPQAMDSPKDAKQQIERRFDSANAVAFEAKTDGPNRWRIAAPRDMIAEIRLAAADAKFLPKEPRLAPDLAKALPEGRIIRLSSLDKTISVVPAQRMRPELLAVTNLVSTGSPYRTLLGWPDVPPEDILGAPGRRCFLAFCPSEGTAPKEAADASCDLLAFEITSDWSETSVTWQTLPVTAPEPAVALPFLPAAKRWKALDVTPILKAAAEAHRNSSGVLLRFREELSAKAPNAAYRSASYSFGGRLAPPRESPLGSSEGRRTSNVRPLLVIVDPETPGAQAAAQPAPVSPATSEPTPLAPLAPVVSEGLSTREQRLEERKEELRALVEKRKAEAAAQIEGANPAK